MSKKGVIETLALLSAAYMRELTDPTIQLYIQGLSDIDDNALLGAAEDCVVNSRYFPTIAELREVSAYRMSPLGKPPVAEVAWSEVMQRVVTIGRTERPTFSHPAIMATLDLMGGYGFVCSSNVSNEESLRRSFVKLYGNYSKTLLAELSLVDRKELNP